MTTEFDGLPMIRPGEQGLVASGRRQCQNRIASGIPARGWLKPIHSSRERAHNPVTHTLDGSPASFAGVRARVDERDAWLARRARPRKSCVPRRGQGRPHLMSIFASSRRGGEESGDTGAAERQLARHARQRAPGTKPRRRKSLFNAS